MRHMDNVNVYKTVDWHDSYNLLIKGRKTTVHSRLSQGDIFYDLFLGDICLGSQCQKQCKYKYDNSSADIRIGDLLGKTYQFDQKGVSALISFTNRGYAIIKELKNVTLVEHPLNVVAEGQMKENAQSKPFCNLVMNHLKTQKSIGSIYFKSMLFSIKVIAKLNRIFFS